MSAVCLIDTSVLLNLLKVPGRSQDAAAVGTAFGEYAAINCTFILPMATILETGNHIAQNGNGSVRRETAQRFCEAVAAAFSDEPPYRLTEFPNTADVMSWLAEFPEKAGQNKSPARTNEGTSFGDMSIIKEYEKCVARFPMTEIFVWSLDSDLATLQHIPTASKVR